MAQNPIVTIEMENGEVIRAELYPEIAPNTVNNFISLIQKGFYDGVIFHRVIPGFMIQGGDPQGTGMGGPGYCIRGEFSHNGFANDLKHTPGVLSMARTMVKDSAGSQFFIMHQTSPHLDGEYAAFGQGDGGYGCGGQDRQCPQRLAGSSHGAADDENRHGRKPSAWNIRNRRNAERTLTRSFCISGTGQQQIPDAGQRHPNGQTALRALSFFHA